jgi:hypothetical protein
MTDKRTRWAIALCWLCLVGDGGTGLMLMAVPHFALERMGVASPPAELVYIRYIGVFVLFAGLAYALPLIRRDALRTVLELTTVLRLMVAAFVSGAMLTHSLDGGWWSVPVYDGLLAFLQAGFLVAERRS